MSGDLSDGDDDTVVDRRAAIIRGVFLDDDVDDEADPEASDAWPERSVPRRQGWLSRAWLWWMRVCATDDGDCTWSPEAERRDGLGPTTAERSDMEPVDHGDTPTPPARRPGWIRRLWSWIRRPWAYLLREADVGHGRDCDCDECWLERRT